MEGKLRDMKNGRVRSVTFHCCEIEDRRGKQDVERLAAILERRSPNIDSDVLRRIARRSIECLHAERCAGSYSLHLCSFLP